MTKQELNELLKDQYPKIERHEKRLFDRLDIFPDALTVYEKNLENIYTRSGEWFFG